MDLSVFIPCSRSIRCDEMAFNRRVCARPALWARETKALRATHMPRPTPKEATVTFQETQKAMARYTVIWIVFAMIRQAMA